MPQMGQPSLIGEVLDGRYKIIKLLGEGGMGQVYAAEHVHIEKRYAIKLLRPEIVSNAEAVSRFRQEARSSSSIGHRNIIAIEDFGALPDGRIYMCMELLNGQALNDLITQPLTVERLLNILIQTGHGLAAAHAKNIVHRDMKPENIFVTIGPNGEDVPKILDFGIAKVAGNEGGNHLTRTGTIFGTPFYMAPEQALGNPVDQRTDIYAMGVIAYEVFAGSLPFQGESFMGILTQHITTDPEPVAQRAAKAGRQLPLGLAELITRCMRKTPSERFGTMDELVNALIQIYRSIAGAGMSSYMEAFPVGQSAPHNHLTPGGMQSPGYQGPGPGPGAPLQTANTPGQGMYAPQPGQGNLAPTPYPLQPGPPPMHPGPSQPVPALSPSQSGMYDPAASVVAPKKSKVGLIIAILVVLALGGGAAAFVVINNRDAGGGGTGSGSALVAIASGAGPASGGIAPIGSNHEGSAGSNAGTTSVGSAGSAAGGSNGSAMVTTSGSNGSAGNGAPLITPGSDVGPGSAGSAAVGPGSAGSAAVGPGSATTIPPEATMMDVFVETKPFVDKFELWENGKKIDAADTLSIVPKSKHTYVLKAHNYKDKTFTVDGTTKRVIVAVSAVPSAHPIPPIGPVGTPPPPKEDCSAKLVAKTASCRKQFCATHPDFAACLTEP